MNSRAEFAICQRVVRFVDINGEAECEAVKDARPGFVVIRWRKQK